MVELHLIKPTGSFGVGVGQGRVSAQVFVDFKYRRADGHVHISSGFDRLDHASDAALVLWFAYFSEIHKHNIAQGFLCMHRDAHKNSVCIDANPRMF